MDEELQHQYRSLIERVRDDPTFTELKRNLGPMSRWQRMLPCRCPPHERQYNSAEDCYSILCWHFLSWSCLSVSSTRKKWTNGRPTPFNEESSVRCSCCCREDCGARWVGTTRHAERIERLQQLRQTSLSPWYSIEWRGRYIRLCITSNWATATTAEANFPFPMI